MSISPIHCPNSGCYWSAHGIPDKYTDARAWHLAAHRAEEHSEPLAPEQIAYATKAGHTLPAAVAAQGARPVPVGDQPHPLDDARLAEIREHIATARNWSLGNLAARDLLAEVERLKAELASAREDAAFTERNTLPELRRTVEHHEAGKQRWRDRAEKAEARIAGLEQERHTTNEALTDAAETLRANRDRIAELEAELAKYVGQEPTVAEEVAYLRRCINAVAALHLPEKLKVDSISRAYRNGYVHALADMRHALELTPAPTEEAAS
ncbi:hypothetical protein ACIQXA_08675 [Streptomyces massasporeus]|uniref:hypothetical protein n=1 Tax=Streptomyces massasporeus TaxID=67324 RepID=UPI0038071316